MGFTSRGGTDLKKEQGFQKKILENILVEVNTQNSKQNPLSNKPQKNVYIPNLI